MRGNASTSIYHLVRLLVLLRIDRRPHAYIDLMRWLEGLRLGKYSSD
jgi:hypothetical protein